MPSFNVSNEIDALYYTGFNLPKSKPIEASNRALIQEAISKNNMLLIRNLKNDETGDNFSFTSKKIQIIPVLIIFHRNNYYVGGYNLTQDNVVIYGVRQMEDVTILPKKCKPNDYFNLVSKEMASRFGVTKNINPNKTDGTNDNMFGMFYFFIITQIIDGIMASVLFFIFIALYYKKKRIFLAAVSNLQSIIVL